MGRAAASGSNAGEAAGASLNLSWQDMRQITEEQAVTKSIQMGVVMFLRLLALLLVAFATTELYRVTYAVALVAVALCVFDSAALWANTMFLAGSV